MDDANIEEFKRKLLQLQSELREQEKVSKESGNVVELDQAKMGRLSRMDAMQLQQMELEEARRRQQRLVKIDGALRRMEAGEYGECFICGEEIDIRRLSFDVTSTRCVGCVDK